MQKNPAENLLPMIEALSSMIHDYSWPKKLSPDYAETMRLHVRTDFIGTHARLCKRFAEAVTVAADSGIDIRIAGLGKGVFERGLVRASDQLADIFEGVSGVKMVNPEEKIEQMGQIVEAQVAMVRAISAYRRNPV